MIKIDNFRINPGTSSNDAILEQYINRLSSHLKAADREFVELFNQLEPLLQEGIHNDKKKQIYELAGDYYFINYDYNLSVLYYLNAFECMDKINIDSQTVRVVNKICRSYSKINQYQDALYYINFTLEYLSQLSNEDILKLKFNKALCYQALGFNEKALTELVSVKGLSDVSDVDRSFDVLNLQALCYMKLELYKEAISIYTELYRLISTNDDKEKEIIILLNLSRAYSYMDDKQQVLRCVEEAMLKLKHLDNNSSYKIRIYYKLGQVLLYMDDAIKAEEYFMTAYWAAKDIKNIYYQKKILNYLFDICEKYNKLNLACFIKNQLLQLLSSENIDFNWKLIFKLLAYFNNLNENHQVNELLTMILNIK